MVLGPTASGKTALSLEIASGLGNAEIVNSDSRQLYRHLDIGTAKIQPEEMQGIPHHLLSVLDPKEKVTVGWYKREAERVIDQILSRGNVPLLVGGSMLYISAITDGYVFEGRGMKTRMPVLYDVRSFGVTWPRSELRARIKERTRELFEKGWIDEVRSLLARGYTRDDPGLESTGYREIMEALASGGSINQNSLARDIARKTAQYAKRQMTWWRRNPRITWLQNL